MVGSLKVQLDSGLEFPWAASGYVQKAHCVDRGRSSNLGREQRTRGRHEARGIKLRAKFFITSQFLCHPIEFSACCWCDKIRFYLSKIRFHPRSKQEVVRALYTGTWGDFYREKEKQSKDGADWLWLTSSLAVSNWQSSGFDFVSRRHLQA